MPTIETTTVSLGEHTHGKFRARNPYYSEAHARQVEHILLDFKDNPREMFVSASRLKCTVSTLANRLTYAFKWLAENGEEAKKDTYSLIRTTFKLVRAADGIFIVPLIAKLPVLVEQATFNEIKKKNWFEIFTEWTAKAKEMEQFDSLALFGKLKITEAEELSLLKLCAQLNIELDFKRSEGCFVAMK